MALAIFRAVGLFGGVFLLPIFLESQVGYTTVQTGLWMMPGAVSVGFMMPIAGRLADRFRPRWLVVGGSLATGLSLIAYGNLDPLSGWEMIIGPQVLRGAGLALMMAPLMAAALNAVPRSEVATASSFLNVAQRVGVAFGIALLNTFVTDTIHTHAPRIAGQLGSGSTAYARFAAHAAQWVPFSAHGLVSGGPLPPALAAAQAIGERAQVLGFDNGFVLGGWIVLLGIPLALWLRKEHHDEAGSAAQVPQVQLTPSDGSRRNQ